MSLNGAALTEEVTVVTQVLRIPRKLVRPFAGQPREYFDQQELYNLANSIKSFGQIMPAIVKPVNDDPVHRFELIEGQRRWHATEIAGISFLDAVLDTDIKSVQHQYEKSAIANFCKSPHTPIETMKIMIRFRDATNPPRSQSDIACLLGCHQVTVSQYLSLESLSPEILVRLRPDTPKDEKISFGTAVKLSRLPPHIQDKASKLILRQQMRFREAQNLVQTLADQSGIRITRASHTPREDYRRFHGFLDRTESDAAALKGRVPGFFGNMFLNRPSADRKDSILGIRRIIEELEAIKDRIQRETDLANIKSKT